MKKVFLCSLLILVFALKAVAQFSCSFQYVPQAGAVYCYVFNQTGYQAPILLVATDVNGNTRSWNCFLYPGGNTMIGPNQGWIWEADETITVYYTYYGEPQSLSWRYTPQRNNVSFRGDATPPNSQSDGYIYTGTSVKVNGNYYKLYRRDGHRYVYDSSSGWIRLKD